MFSSETTSHEFRLNVTRGHVSSKHSRFFCIVFVGSDFHAIFIFHRYRFFYNFFSSQRLLKMFSENNAVYQERGKAIIGGTLPY